MGMNDQASADQNRTHNEGTSRAAIHNTEYTASFEKKKKKRLYRRLGQSHHSPTCGIRALGIFDPAALVWVFHQSIRTSTAVEKKVMFMYNSAVHDVLNTQPGRQG